METEAQTKRAWSLSCSHLPVPGMRVTGPSLKAAYHSQGNWGRGVWGGGVGKKSLSKLWEGNLAERSLPWCRQWRGHVTGQCGLWYHHLGTVLIETPSKNLKPDVSQ